MMETNKNAGFELLRAAEAVTNWRAMAVAALGVALVAACAGLTVVMGKASFVLGAGMGLLTLVAAMVAYSAVGIYLMRQAQGQVASLGSVFMLAILSVHRLLGIAVLLFVGLAVLVLAAALILLACKIPGIGNILFAVAIPVLTVVIGMAVAGMFWVAFPLAAPAVWEGNTVLQAMARLGVIVRSRLLAVIAEFVLLGMLVSLLSLVVYGVMFSGYSLSMGLSTAVGIDAFGAGNMLRTLSLLARRDRADMYGEIDMPMSYDGASAFALGVVFAISAIAPVLTFINGTCLVYLRNSAGLEFGKMESQLQDKLQRVAAAPACPACSAPVAKGDAFCAECGARCSP
jgi:hypothetical protein